MANKTIYGCVEADRTITFEQDGCEYPACIIRDPEDEHFNMVAVTIDTGCCDDIYYGCVNWPSGKFGVSVPDNCCPSTEYCDNICTTCDTCHLDNITITFSGIISGCSFPCRAPCTNSCSYSGFNAINDTFLCVASGQTLGDGGCRWTYNTGFISTANLCGPYPACGCNTR